MIEDKYQRQDTMHMRSHKGRNGPTDRPAMTSPARGYAQNMSQQPSSPEHSIPSPVLVSADDSYFNISVPEIYPRAAPHARFPTFFMGLQSRSGQKRHLDGYDEEAETEAEEPLHKRPRPSAARHADESRWTSTHERTSDTTWRKVERFSRVGRWDLQHGTVVDAFRREERRNLNMNSAEPSHDGTAEAEQRRKGAAVESFGISPLNIATGSCGVFQNSESLRPILGSLKKKVRFEDEISGKALRKPACLGNNFDDTPEQQLAGSGPHSLNPIQQEVLNQPADADVMMVDV